MSMSLKKFVHTCWIFVHIQKPDSLLPLYDSMTLWCCKRLRKPEHAEKSCMTSCPRATQEGYVYPLPLPLWLYLEFNMRESVNLLPLLSDTSHRWIHTPMTNPAPPVHAWHALRAYTLLSSVGFFFNCPESFWATTVLQIVALWLVFA